MEKTMAIIEHGFFTIPNLKFLALANLELWPAGKKAPY